MNVLIVDDDKVDRLTVRELLKECCNVVEAPSEAETWRQLESSTVDCVLLDYLIPGTDTLRLLSELVAVPLPVIILTGEGSEHIAVTAMKQGAQDYLSKHNLTGELLIRTISNAVDTAMLNRKLAQKQQALSSINDELRRKVSELERAKLEAEEANRTKVHFLAVLSHELRTPLTPVLAGLSVLKNDESISQSAKADLDIVRRNAELEAHLIDDLLDLNRISRGKIELVKHRVELRTIVERTLEVCRPDIEVKGLYFAFDYGPGPYYINGDEARLQQIFWNLIKNAVKFTPAGGCIGVSCRPEQGFVVVSVSDSGIGIDPTSFDSIFDAFAQAETAKARRFGGLGLGLAIAKALVEMHGGTISAHSQGKDKGSVFTVRLPTISGVEQAPANDDATADREHAASPLRILLVEDHGDTADLMSRILKLEGYQVQTAGDVASGLKTATAGRFDLLLTDLGLPDGTGLDLLQKLRAVGATIPAIAVTGFGQDSDLEQTRAAGFASHLVKPVDIGRLLDTVARTVGVERAPSITSA